MRVKREIPVLCVHGDRQIEARTVDVSHDGICLAIAASSPLPVGETVDLTLNDASLKAQVMWVAGEGERQPAVHGLRLIGGNFSSV